MKTSKPFTAAVFSAFLKCQTKAYLVAVGEAPPDTFFSDIEQRISTRFKATAKPPLATGSNVEGFLEFQRSHFAHNLGSATHLVDCDSATYDLSPSLSEQGRPTPSKLPVSDAVLPVLFVPSDKPSLSESLLLCFGAVALEQFTGVRPNIGTLVYGEGHCQKNLKVENHLVRTHEVIGSIKQTLDAAQPPPLVLNRHCTVCDYQRRCRGIAIERDDLSLLTAMTAKDRTKSNAKGISTITQLSYGYRPRRRKRTRLDLERAKKSVKRAPPPAKNDHKLKALAIKKGQIHVIGTPSFKIEGTPVFVDVEGMPDRDFYYLIGLRFEVDGNAVEHSYWADSLGDEREIWGEFLGTLKEIDNAQIVSYGAYETRFLRQMKDRYPLSPEDAEFVDRIVERSINLLGWIYGTVYFPTFSNSLKDVGRYLGFEWTWANASGAAAPLLRRAWEVGAGDNHRGELITYNMEDCKAASTIADALIRLGGDDASGLNEVGVGSLEARFQRTFGRFDSAMPEFTMINQAAYWNYQRSKVYVRTDKIVRRTIAKEKGKSKNISIEREEFNRQEPDTCVRCGSTKFWSPLKGSRIVYDLRFMKKGVKRWVVRQHYTKSRCALCKAELTHLARVSRYGPHLRAFVVYLIIELRISNQKAADHVSLLFDLPVKKEQCNRFKSDMAERYTPTHQGILRQLSSGTLLHADETKGVVRGGGHYVWVFTNLTTVGYVYSESREGTALASVLDGFRGVLVSDFYAAYDSALCPQQKCLIHLMRDINEDLHKNPFDEELKEIARRFGVLLREIVETIDMHGLKSRYLGKHKQTAERFIENVVAMKCTTEAGSALRKRIEKNHDKLFTFLTYDGIPWNNNNAEHAVRAFAKLRNVIGTSTPKGTQEYATLLSVQQTLKYRGMDFLEFLRSGRIDIDP
jgi:predicted RecB family nuclease